MITTLHRAKTISDAQRYIRYTIAPEKDKASKHYHHGERLMDVTGENIDIDPQCDMETGFNKISHKLANQLDEWNQEHRTGKNLPSSPVVLGVIALAPADTEKFMVEIYTQDEEGKPVKVRYLDTNAVLALGRENINTAMGSERAMFLGVHGDHEHLHIHFAAAVVDNEGKIYNGSIVNEDGKKLRDFRRWEMVNEELEKKYDLTRVMHRKAFAHEGEHRQAQVKRPSNAVVHLANKGELAPSLDIANRLELAYAESNKQFDKFLELAESKGIHIKPNMGTDKVNGLSFSMDGMDNFIKASDFGNKYKWAKLSKELNYEHQRDYPKLAELKTTAGSNQRTTIEATNEIERLARITEQMAEAVRIEQSVNVADNGTNPGVGYEERQQPERASALSKEATGHRAFEGSTTTADTVGASTNKRDPTSDIRVPDSPNPVHSNGVRYVESIQQSSQSAGNNPTATEGLNSPEQSNLRGSEEDKVRSRELRIKTIMASGAMTREQAEFAYDTQQTVAAKREAEKEAASTWTPDKSTTPDQKSKSFSEAMEAFQKQSNRQQQSQTYGRSDDGYSM